MNIEIANRLYQYRKKNNMSQEELAEKLGISRQAVSKWERAEASPDTDNLINLAKLYGVSLDELINSDPVAKDTSKESADTSQTASENQSNTDSSEIGSSEKETTANKEKNNANITISTDGIHYSDEEDSVHINFKGIHVIDGKDSVHVGLDGIRIKEGGDADEEVRVSFGLKPKWADAPVAIIVVFAYLILGTVFNLWHPGWIIFLTIPIISGVIDAIIKRRLREIPYPIVVVLVYFLIGYSLELWHPGWILFLTIPIFYWLVD